MHPRPMAPGRRRRRISHVSECQQHLQAPSEREAYPPTPPNNNQFRTDTYLLWNTWSSGVVPKAAAQTNEGGDTHRRAGSRLHVSTMGVGSPGLDHSKNMDHTSAQAGTSPGNRPGLSVGMDWHPGALAPGDCKWQRQLPEQEPPSNTGMICRPAGKAGHGLISSKTLGMREKVVHVPSGVGSIIHVGCNVSTFSSTSPLTFGVR
ncbi:hypothetical protein QBC39DRAFT_358199 [Podospora conica]|nr:hypothetical protein QBC39DRAFT_358199 [Schizothecium conicum]